MSRSTERFWTRRLNIALLNRLLSNCPHVRTSDWQAKGKCVQVNQCTVRRVRPLIASEYLPSPYECHPSPVRRAELTIAWQLAGWACETLYEYIYIYMSSSWTCPCGRILSMSDRCPQTVDRRKWTIRLTQVSLHSIWLGSSFIVLRWPYTVDETLRSKNWLLHFNLKKKKKRDTMQGLRIDWIREGLRRNEESGILTTPPTQQIRLLQLRSIFYRLVGRELCACVRVCVC